MLRPLRYLDHIGRRLFRALAGVPVVRQVGSQECGLACLQMIAAYHDRPLGLAQAQELIRVGRAGSSVAELAAAATKLAFAVCSVEVDYETLRKEVPLPCIAHWDNRHFVVVYRVGRGGVVAVDPAIGKVRMSRAEFERGWAGRGHGPAGRGVALVLEPSVDHVPQTGSDSRSPSLMMTTLATFGANRTLVGQMALLVALGIGFQAMLPVVTAAIIDRGVARHNPSLVALLLLGQLAIVIGRTLASLVRQRITTLAMNRYHLARLDGYLDRLLSLPLTFFEQRGIGDILQRVDDNGRVKQFMMGTALEITYSLLSFIVFGAVLLWYSVTIFWLFIAGSILQALMTFWFLPRRRALEHRHFSQLSRVRDAVVELVVGMSDLRLTGALVPKRGEWYKEQDAAFTLESDTLTLDQAQAATAVFVNEAKNFAINLTAAMLTMDGRLTIGALLAIQYVHGQLNAPLSQLVGSIAIGQDAAISLQRIAEVEGHDTEEGLHGEGREQSAPSETPPQGGIALSDVFYTYPANPEQPVLHGITATIPAGQLTAIAGPSGCGKTTLLRILLGLYRPDRGRVTVGGRDLHSWTLTRWRRECGVVLQEGNIFAGTIAANVTLGSDGENEELLREVLLAANALPFVSGLSQGTKTHLGGSGQGLSQGQRQRLLIARALYRKPAYLFLDEATSALDVLNEEIIVNQLKAARANRTTVLIAHRLSVFKRVDHILFMSDGRVVEEGSHARLVETRGPYFQMIRSQLGPND